MLNTLAAVTAAAAALGSPAPTYAPPPPPRPSAAPLPDFPTEARPGECWTRARVGAPGAAPADVGQPVWVLKRGRGPEAVWQFHRRPVPTTGPVAYDGPYQWVRVACDPNERVYAEAPPAPPAFDGPPPPPPPPPPALPEPPMRPHGPMHHAMPQHEGPPMASHGPMHQSMPTQHGGAPM